jgi:putative resolvase
MNNEYISANKITRKYDITSGTLRRWTEENKIRCIRPNPESLRGGKRLYNTKDINKIFGQKEEDIDERITLCYARVSSNHQKEDLERQIEVLSKAYPNSKVIKDIGSGINWKRQGFRALLERVSEGNVKEVVVTYKDRMCRFGYELVEWILQKNDTKLVVLNKDTDVQDISRELSDDLLAITTVFVAKNNGLRAAQYKRDRKESKSSKDTDISIKVPKEDS